MSVLAERLPEPGDAYRPRRLLMCRPEYFAVSYEINPWMHAAMPVDRRLALRQWEQIVRTYESLGHIVEFVDPVLGLPDMVFAANSGVVINGRVYLAKFRYPERAGEEVPYAEWFRTHGFDEVIQATEINEGEGDFALVGGTVFAGYGFRTDLAAHDELRARLCVPVVSLRLVDPRFYHLDTALTVLRDDTIAYFPGAFDAASRDTLRARFPHALIVEERDAEAFGCNAMSDGHHVIVSAQATGFIETLRSAGFDAIPIDTGELRKAGGSVKCCTLELRGDTTMTDLLAPPTDLEWQHAAHNYKPLPVMLARGEGAWVEDAAGRRYLDMLAGYSALNFGHRHPALVAAAHSQLDKLTLTARAFSNDALGPFAAELAALCGKDAVVPMNTGAEAVETAIKIARRWGYERKGIAANSATIIVFDHNFHGRTTTIVGFSSDEESKAGFGPFTPGFRRVRYGDIGAFAAAIDDTVAAVLIEPIQGEAGVVIPPAGYLAAVRDLCRTYNILMIADEVQSGFGRAGKLFACDHENVVPDMYVLGKALGGGIVPVSAVVGDWDVLDVLTPGSHGSTFGGNPLACAVGLAVIELVRDGSLFAHAASLEETLRDGLRQLIGFGVDAVRVRGLWAGVELSEEVGTGRRMAEELITNGVLSKDTHGQTLRLSPPLVITRDELEWGLERIRESLTRLLVP